MNKPLKIGHMVLPPGFTGPVDPTDLDLLVFTKQGRCQYDDGETGVTQEPGDVLFVPRTMRGVKWRVLGESPWDVIWFFVTLDKGRLDLLTGSDRPLAMRQWHTVGLTRARVESGFIRLSHLQGIDHASAARLRAAWVDVILAELRLDADSFIATPDPLAAKARAFLDSRIAAPISIDDLVTACGVGRTSLIVRFTRAVGVSPMKYLEERRLATAAERLRSGRDAVADIARSVGYANPRYFATRFRHRYGCTPGAWREGTTS